MCFKLFNNLTLDIHSAHSTCAQAVNKIVNQYHSQNVIIVISNRTCPKITNAIVLLQLPFRHSMWIL